MSKPNRLIWPFGFVVSGEPAVWELKRRFKGVEGQ